MSEGVCMTKIRLSILGDYIASNRMLSDVEHFKELQKEKIASFLRWVVKRLVHDERYTTDEWQKLCEHYHFKSTDELYSAGRFASALFMTGTEVDRSDLVKDLQKLDFEKETIELIVSTLESAWADSHDYLIRSRDEAIPVLHSFNWRVDIRHSSSDYLLKPQVVALLRIGVTDGTRRHELHFELNKETLSWFETGFGRMKREFLKVEESLLEED